MNRNPQQEEGVFKPAQNPGPSDNQQAGFHSSSALSPPFFLLGTHQPGWLATSKVPLFISDRRLCVYRNLPRAVAPWALDSGAFSELAIHGNWDHGPSPLQYVERIRKYQRQTGKLLWAAQQDWMCEPFILARTELSVAEHQARTVENFCTLKRLAPELPIIPVVQGWEVTDYVRCVELYRAAGVDLTKEPLVGVGSVCRRQASGEVQDILLALHRLGVSRLHGFGVKAQGLKRYGHLLASADSMAWSMAARRGLRLKGCTGHANCANCPRFALRWRRRMLVACGAEDQVMKQGGGRGQFLTGSNVWKEAIENETTENRAMTVER